MHWIARVTTARAADVDRIDLLPRRRGGRHRLHRRPHHRRAARAPRSADRRRSCGSPEAARPADHALRLPVPLRPRGGVRVRRGHRRVARDVVRHRLAPEPPGVDHRRDDLDRGRLPAGGLPGPAQQRRQHRAARRRGADALWSDAEMHDAMQTYWSRFANVPQWSVWTFFASLSDQGTGLGGIMFDDIGPNHRQGTAIFHDSFISEPPPGDPDAAAAVARIRFWTAVHELGHAFNLAHAWQKSLGIGGGGPWVPLVDHPEARSFMNYPYRVAGRRLGVLRRLRLPLHRRRAAVPAPRARAVRAAGQRPRGSTTTGSSRRTSRPSRSWRSSCGSTARTGTVCRRSGSSSRSTSS